MTGHGRVFEGDGEEVSLATSTKETDHKSNGEPKVLDPHDTIKNAQVRVVGTFVHCIHPLSVIPRCDFPMVFRKDPGHDHALLFELPYGLNFAGLVCTVI